MQIRTASLIAKPQSVSVRILVLLFFLLNFSVLHPIHSIPFSVQKISLAEGLSQSSVSSISQDRKGFLWIGTQDGLNKYDGLTFKTYYHIPFDSNSLSSGNIASLLHDSQGRFWIGTTNQGLNLYRERSDNFRTFFHNQNNRHSLLNNTINVIYEGPSGTLWLGTGNGLQKIVVTENNNSEPIIEFETVFRDTSTTALLNIYTIYESTQGDVWIGTSRGLLKLSFNRNHEHLPVGGTIYTSKDGLSADHVLAFLPDPYGNYWIGTTNGICIIDSTGNRIKKIPLQATFNQENNKEIWNIFLSSDSTLWISGNHGLFTITAVDTENIFESDPEMTPLKNGDKECHTGGVMAIQEDQISKGIIWIGTQAHGILKAISSPSKIFYTNHLENILTTAFVFSILKDENGLIWIGTTSGLIRFNKSKNEYRLFHIQDEKPNGLRSNYIVKIVLDKNNNMWIGTQKGFYKTRNRYSENPSFELIPLNARLHDAPVKDIHLDDDGNMLIALPGRLYHFSTDTQFATELTNGFRDNKLLPIGFSFMSVLEDKSENIWLGSTSGLYVYEKRNMRDGHDFSNPLIIQHNPKDTNSIRSHNINDLFEDSKGNIWISTPNGLTKAVFSGDKIKLYNYSTREGLKNNAVYGVLENTEDGMLWMSTNGGLSRFDPVSQKFKNYDIHDGLQSNEFNGGAFFRTEDNEFFFGGVNGFTSFYPHEIREDSIPPRVYITSASLSESKRELISGTDNKIKLRHHENSISIAFIALQYANPGRNNYMYRLKGYQEEWTHTTNAEGVSYTQLPPGEFIFEVRGANADGVFSKEAQSITFLIQAPFWKTIWFYVLIALLIALFAWLLHAYLLKLKLKQVEEIELIRQETAADFHDELGHKLTTISWFGEILKKKLGTDQVELRHYLDKIIETAGSLYHTMRDMVWAMDPGKDSVKDLYKQMQEFGQSLFDQTGVEFRAADLNGECNEVTIPLNKKRHVLLIFKEAMHNSFRHSGSDKVKLNLFRENNHVTIQLTDNGSGFHLDWTKTGNGLKNVRKRSEAIGGKLKLESNQTGTVLELEIPLSN